MIFFFGKIENRKLHSLHLKICIYICIYFFVYSEINIVFRVKIILDKFYIWKITNKYYLVETKELETCLPNKSWQTRFQRPGLWSFHHFYFTQVFIWTETVTRKYLTVSAGCHSAAAWMESPWVEVWKGIAFRFTLTGEYHVIWTVRLCLV